MSLAFQGNLAVDPPLSLTDEEIRAQPDPNCKSARFETSGQARNFLTLVMEDAFSNHCIDVNSTATDVFGHSDAFRAQTGPVERMGTWRVRREVLSKNATAVS
ncbi:hypothetical protein [Sinorhizobium sp. BG8]|uniref:hypothetical protein n=1 Tax=Sinorhizobium sp. BG8 TaxID=2613773 RepID=UPI00193C9ABB|nr:hypothetical protein [Sinorhizobium sp. BG8]QRM56680.1 hypothetical protein F3Y30_20690 [Sinorhizobium sp. BG8]